MTRTQKLGTRIKAAQERLYERSPHLRPVKLTATHHEAVTIAETFAAIDLRARLLWQDAMDEMNGIRP